MKIKKQIPALFLAMCLMVSMSIISYAYQAPDTDKVGSISVTMKYNEKTVSGGVLTLYRVGEINEDDGNYSFVLTEDYAGCDVSLDDLESSALARSLAEYTSENKLAGTEVKIGDDGKAVFSGLETGLYLIVQTEAAPGYEAVSPFLVSVPMNENGTYVYDVDATPKVGTLTEKQPEPSQPVTPSEPEPSQPVTPSEPEPSQPVTPSKPEPSQPAAPSKPTLPQTGQLNWPVPLMASLGLCLIFLGCALRFEKKGASYEA